MKLTKFIVALFAALAMFSCSKEEIIVDNSQALNPGDALLSFKIGSKITTYASNDDELLIKDLKVFMSYIDDSNANKLIKIPESGVTTNGLNFTLNKGSYKEGSTATLYFVANAGSATLPTITGTYTPDISALESAVETTPIYTITNAGSTSNSLALGSHGMTATRKFNIKLNQGVISSSSDDNTITAGAFTLKRLAARIYVESATSDPLDIKGFTIKIDQLSKGVRLFDYVPDRTTTVTALDPYFVTGSPTGQYNNKEAVGYVYPSTSADLSITIAPPSTYSGIPSQTLTVKPVANNNYKITITPGDGNTTKKFVVTIGPWNNIGTDLTPAEGLLFNPPSVVPGTAANPAVVNPSASIQNGNLVLDLAVSNTIDINKIIDLGTGNTVGTNGVTVTTTVTGSASNSIGAVTLTPSTGSDINLSYPTNYSSDDVTGQTIEVAISKDGVFVSTVKVPIVIKATPLPDGFLYETFSGAEFMHMSTRGTIIEDIAAFNTINNHPYVMNDAISFGEKLEKWYVGGGGIRWTIGNAFKFLAGKENGTCPKGFRMPTEAEYASITGNTTISQVNVSAVGTWVNGPNNTKYRTAFEGDTNLTHLQQYYRMAQYNGKSMMISYHTDNTSAPSKLFGERISGLGGGNLGVGVTASNEYTTFYKPVNNAATFSTRCVKDKSATDVIW